MSDAVKNARACQRRAADPARSIVLEAAAGSGKTKVLVDRFLRLCLTGPGVDPFAVLAITFTRKATVEIQARLQAQARALATLRGADLKAALADILDREPAPIELERAAWFHEALLADPAGLGIDTLHAFCQKVLARFAADAGLDPRFALDRLESSLAADAEDAEAYAALADTAAGARGKVAGFFNQRMVMQRWLDRVAPCGDQVAAALARPAAPHAGVLADDLRRAAVAGTPWEDAADLDPALLAPALSGALREFAGAGLDALAAIDAPLGFTDASIKQRDGWRDVALAGADRLDGDPTALLEVAVDLRASLLTKAGKLLAAKGKNDTKDDRRTALATATGPVLGLLALLGLRDLLQRNESLLRFGLRALDEHAAIKRRDRVVDFQDLEYLALRLLTDPDTGRQVHYRLDARLDHLLLDEFQDTNRNQWDLLFPLLDVILADGTATRTAFVVGDVKQSIYGFRGAEPAVFAGARALFAKQAGADALLRLPTNFRSLPNVVETVGALFQHEPLASCLGAEAAGAAQDVARHVDPGKVVFVEPYARVDQDSGHERAAQAVVDLVARLLDGGGKTWNWDPTVGRDEPREFRRDDILILARTKTHLASYETALRRAGIPFAPAGRGLLARSREVQDVLALLRWLTFPADDTDGATVLRSPFFRMPEARVQTLLASRRVGTRRSLRDVLRQDEPEVSARLEGWFRLAGLLPLHDLLRRIVREGQVLERFETAGGEQARFNLLRLMDLALAAEDRGGSLRDFVAELDKAARLGGEEEGTLPGESGTGRVRVMTVHGSKGLEAPVVILVDAAAALKDTAETILLADGPADGPWLQGVRKEHVEGPEPAADNPLAPHHERARNRQLAEEAHILYVAMTRARDRLYVLGGRNDRAGAAGFGNYLEWLDQADTAPDRDTRWRTPEAFADTEAAPTAGASAPTTDHAARAAAAVAHLRAWTPPTLAPRFQTTKPSQLEDDRGVTPVRDGGTEPADAAPPPSRRDNDATRRGTRIHAWLERACLLGAMPVAPGGDAERRAEWDEARAVFEDPDLGWIFHPEGRGGRGLSEVPIVHRVPSGAVENRVSGFIDRLIVGPDRIDVVDYKSNRIDHGSVADAASHYRPQLRAYRDALSTLYPDREIRCWLLWTCPDLADARLTEVSV